MSSDPTPSNPTAADSHAAAPSQSRRSLGVGRVLIVVYAILAIGATSRAVYQMATVYSTAPVAITLSALSGIIYIVATIALLRQSRTWYRVAWVTISFELLGVIVMGQLFATILQLILDGRYVIG